MDLSLLLAITLVALVGLPHGALDPVVAKRSGLMDTPKTALVFLLGYSGVAMLVAWFWTWLPLFSLVMFLLISAQHFGRDWHHHIGFGGVAYGAAILGLPAWFQPTEVDRIFEFLVFGRDPAIAVITLQTLGIMGLLMLCFEIRRLTPVRWLELMLLAVCAWLLHPIWYFVIYFCGLHSPRHLFAEYRKMSEGQKTQAVAIMAGITLLTLALAIGSGIWLQTHSLSLDALLYQITFIGLFALTVPHMALMEWSRSRNGSE